MPGRQARGGAFGFVRGWIWFLFCLDAVFFFFFGGGAREGRFSLCVLCFISRGFESCFFGFHGILLVCLWFCLRVGWRFCFDVVLELFANDFLCCI